MSDDPHRETIGESMQQFRRDFCLKLQGVVAESRPWDNDVITLGTFAEILRASFYLGIKLSELKKVWRVPSAHFARWSENDYWSDDRSMSAHFKHAVCSWILHTLEIAK